MDRVGKWKWQLLLSILALSVLTMIAGSSAAAPFNPEPEGQVVVVEQSGVSDLKPSLNAVTTVKVVPEPEGQVVVAEQNEAPDLQPFIERRYVSVEAPVDPEPERQVVVAELSEASDLQPSSSAVVPSTEAPTEQQGGHAASTEGEPEPTTTVNQQSEPATKGSGGGTGQTEYTWEDGDRTSTVILQSDLVIDEETSIKDAMADAPGGAIVKSAGAKSEDKGLPVFKSQSGALMTLPGGVLLVLDSDWSQAEVNTFFSNNSIKLSKVEALDFIDNGYFIETEPGFPALDLANALAAEEGVIVSSPNWWTEVTVK